MPSGANPMAPKLLAIQFAFPFEGTLELEETEGGTRVRNTITAGSDSGFTTFMFTVLAPLCRRMMRKQLAKELDRLAVGLPS